MAHFKGDKNSLNDLAKSLYEKYKTIVTGVEKYSNN